MKSLASLLRRAFRTLDTPVCAARLAALGMAICCLTATAFAQSGAGSIQGTVSDSTGAMMPGASIHVVNQATGVTTDTKSNSVGFYQVPSLFTGTYDVTITVTGMTAYKTTLNLLVAQNAVINATLTAGVVTQQVTVSANTVQLTTTDNGAINNTLENAQIMQIPMNGRALLTQAAKATPGLESCSNDSLGACANGLMGQAMEYVVDGVTLTDRQFGGSHSGQSQMPDVDSVQEVRLETSGLGAQYATPAAGVITTKSGTNSLHGSFFETARNNAFGIAKARQDPANYSAPRYIRNEFGASAGGPIILPHIYHGKDKSFWFFGYERYSLSQASSELVPVPTMAFRQGDFSGLLNGSGVLQQLYDPATTQASSQCENYSTGVSASNAYCRTPFANNQIPMSRISPTAKILLDITPQPTYGYNPLVQPNYIAVNPVESRRPSITFRLDHEFNETNRAYLRYTSNIETEGSLRNFPANQPASIAADGLPANATGLSTNPLDLFATAVGYTHVFSPTFYSETILSQQWWADRSIAGGTPLVNFEQQLGLPNNFGEAGFPNWTGIITPFNGTQWEFAMTQIISNLDENLVKTVGRHQMAFGGRYRHERIGSQPDQSQDTIAFGADATSLLDPSTISTNAFSNYANSGYADADMFLGAAASYNVNKEPPYQHLHDMEFDAYFQDNYHLTRNLTINLGLRYEAHPAAWLKNNYMESFDLKNDAMVLSAAPSQLIANGLTTQAIITNIQNNGGKIETYQQAGMPASLVDNSNLEFAPRAGIAWQPFGDKWGTVLRGAYGRYFYPVPIRSSYVQVDHANLPFVASYTMSYTSASQAPTNLPYPNWLRLIPQPVVMGQNSTNVVNSATTTSILPGAVLRTLDPDYPPDVVTQTNVTIEQPLKGNSALRVTWNYSHGSNLDQVYYYNSHPSSYVYEMQTGHTAPNGGASTIGTNQYNATATGPYDQVTWGSNQLEQKSGWSNDNNLQVNYQRLFHHGAGYQVIYVWSKAFRVGGDWSRSGTIYPASNYNNSGLGVMNPDYGPIGPVNYGPIQPSNIAPYAYFRAENRFQNYTVDSAVPMHHIQFNGIVDAPFGQGKRFLGNANRFVDEVVGGWQVAGYGGVVSQAFYPASSMWGPVNPIHLYKHQRITDCRSGICQPENLWFNGYIAPTANADVDCTSKCISNLPSNYVPYETPIDNTPGTTYYGGNPVDITLTNGKKGEITFNPSPQSSNAFSHTILKGPFNYTADLSLFKLFPITEKVNLRFNVDAFNFLNIQGYNNPNTTDGTENFTSSYWTPRQLQFTARLSF